MKAPLVPHTEGNITNIALEARAHFQTGRRGFALEVAQCTHFSFSGGLGGGKMNRPVTLEVVDIRVCPQKWMRWLPLLLTETDEWTAWKHRENPNQNFEINFDFWFCKLRLQLVRKIWSYTRPLAVIWTGMDLIRASNAHIRPNNRLKTWYRVKSFGTWLPFAILFTKLIKFLITKYCLYDKTRSMLFRPFIHLRWYLPHALQKYEVVFHGNVLRCQGIQWWFGTDWKKNITGPHNNYRVWVFTLKGAIWLDVTGSWPLKTRCLHMTIV